MAGGAQDGRPGLTALPDQAAQGTHGAGLAADGTHSGVTDLAETRGTGSDLAGRLDLKLQRWGSIVLPQQIQGLLQKA